MDLSLRFFSREPLKPGILLVCQSILQFFRGSRGYHRWLFYLLFRIFPRPCCTTFCQSRPMQAISISQCYLHGLRYPQRIWCQHHNFQLWDLSSPKIWDTLCVLHYWCHLFLCKETQEPVHSSILPLYTILSSRTCLRLWHRLNESFEDSMLLCSWSMPQYKTPF